MPIADWIFFENNNNKISELEEYKNKFLESDYKSGEGLINSIFPLLEEVPLKIFEDSIDFILENCINVNRSFSDAVEFLSIWQKRSPHGLLKKLKNIILIIELIEELKADKKNGNRIIKLKNEIGIKELEEKLEKEGLTESEKIGRLINKLEQINLKFFFNRTEYSHEGDRWYFPELLKIFEELVDETNTASKILDYVFETFDFFNIPYIFLVEVIGYDRLQKSIEECPAIFKQALVLKINRLVEMNKTINLGLQSQQYLNEEIIKIQDRPPVSKGLISENNVFSSRFKISECSEESSLSNQSNYFRWSNTPFNSYP